MRADPRFEGSRICHSDQDLVVYQRACKATILGMVDALSRDVDEYAAFLLCTVLVDVAAEKRRQILNRLEEVQP